MNLWSRSGKKITSKVESIASLRGKLTCDRDGLLKGLHALDRGLLRTPRLDDVTNSFLASEKKRMGIPKWKRVIDLLCIVLTFPVWWPLMVLVACWVKIVSPGPVFYLQERVGLRGRRFMMLKFRSMKVCAETQCHEQHFDFLAHFDRPMTKLDVLGDPRLIRGGRFLRALGLDELPQIFNVLRREMTLVGPRPCTTHEFPMFSGASRERFEVVPGLTGLWQVNGKNKITFRRMVELDVYYVRRASLQLDLWIMLGTLPALCEQFLEFWRAPGHGADKEKSGAIACDRYQSVAEIIEPPNRNMHSSENWRAN